MKPVDAVIVGGGVAASFNGIYTGGVFRGYQDVSQNAILLQTNNVWNTPIYTGVEVVGSQRTRRSQFIVGYTRGFQHLERHVATERPGVVHSAGRVRERPDHLAEPGSG